MGRYLARRLIYMVITIFAISVVSFIIIQLPPGDFLTNLIYNLERAGTTLAEERLEILKREFGLDLPLYRQYLKWISKIIFEGDFGRSFQHQAPVMKVIGERVLLTMVIAFSTLLFTYVLAIPIGIYSATHQYSFGDFTSTFFGFVGLATPNFMLALVLMYIFFRHFQMDVGGLFSVEYQLAPWSAGKLWDLIKHLPIPIIVIGTAGTAGLIRILRGTLLDELSRQYVITARAKGVHERVLLFKYPVRLALNPIISTVGHLLPAIVSGGTITAVVLGLPTTGPILLEALRQQDMYLAASAVFLLSVLAVIGTLISDLLLVVVDPRIRMEQAAG